MKLIDQYILKTFFSALFYILLTFISVIVVWDMFDHISEFLEKDVSFTNIVKYYAFFIPATLVFLMPATMLLSVLSCLYSMTQANELTAMRASGVSLYRLISPILVVSFFISVGVLIVNETIAPTSSYWTYSFLEQQGNQSGEMEQFESENLSYYNAKEHRNWHIGRFNSKKLLMRDVTISEINPDSGFYRQKIYADEIKWMREDGTWWGENVTYQRYRDFEKGLLDGPMETKGLVQFDFNEKPVKFINEMKDPQFLSAQQLRSYIDSSPQLSDRRIAELTTDIHFRLALPWACFIVTLLGVRFGHTTARKGILTGVVICLSLFFSYYVISQVLRYAGKAGLMEGWVSAWTPNLLFLVIGLCLLRGMR